MQLLHLLGFAAAATAIDIAFFPGGDCKGDAKLHTNAAPNTCYRQVDGIRYQSIGFFGIPFDWRVEARGYSDGNCGTQTNVERGSNTNFICLRTSNNFASAGYGFW